MEDFRANLMLVQVVSLALFRHNKAGCGITDTVLQCITLNQVCTMKIEGLRTYAIPRESQCTAKFLALVAIFGRFNSNTANFFESTHNFATARVQGLKLTKLVG